MQRKALIACHDLKTRAELTSLLGPKFICDIAVNGQETIELIKLRANKNERFCLIITDYNLNDMPGAELLSTIRRLEEEFEFYWPHSARIIALTESERTIVSAFFRGAEACHIYPLDQERLVKQITALEVERV